MATGIVTYKDHPDLQSYIMKDLVRTGRKLGHGAFGVVEEISGGGTFYACKKLNDAITDSEDKEAMLRVSRFVSECKLLSDVRHPNIVQFMGLYFTDESPFPFLVMEELDVSLDQFLEEKPLDIMIPLSLKLHILCDVAKGLVYLHGRNPPVIHRDLTARNVLLNKAAMHAKISDLGNAIIIDPIKLASTLTQIPGTYLYMPPEALGPNPVYNTSLDMFSFGHLFLYTIIQVFPDQLLPPTYYKETAGGREIKARSEVERRSEYFEMLYDSQNDKTLQNTTYIQSAIERCLNNIPEERPTAIEALMILEDLLGNMEDTYTRLAGKSPMDLVSLLEKDKLPTVLATTAPGVDPIRVQQIKGGAPGVLMISKITGRFRKKVQWSECVFKITGTDPYLQYTRNNQVCDRIQLSSVTSVDVLASTEGENGKSDRNSGFQFAVHFSGKQSKSPWILQAHSNEERLSWMEAILPGSGNQNQKNEPVCSEYEDVFVGPPLPPKPPKKERAVDKEDFQSSHPMSQESGLYERMECDTDYTDNHLNAGSNPDAIGRNNAPSKETISSPEELQGRQDETNQAQINVLKNQMQKMMEQIRSMQHTYASADDLGIRSSSKPKVKQVQLPPPPNIAPPEDDKTTESNLDESEPPISEYYDTFEFEDQSAQTSLPMQSSQLTQSPVASPRKNKPASIMTTQTTLIRRDNSVDSERVRTPPPPIAPKPKKQPESPVPKPKPRTRIRSMGGEVLPELPRSIRSMGGEELPELPRSIRSMGGEVLPELPRRVASPLGGSVEQLIHQIESTQTSQKQPVNPLEQFKCHSTPSSPTNIKRKSFVSKPLPSPPITKRQRAVTAAAASLSGANPMQQFKSHSTPSSPTNIRKTPVKKPLPSPPITKRQRAVTVATSSEAHPSNVEPKSPVPRPRKPSIAPRATGTLRREESLEQVKNIRGDLIHYAGKMKFDKMLVSDQNEAGNPIYAEGVESRPDWAKATTTIQSSTSSAMDDTPLAQLQQEAVFIPPSAVQDLIAIGHGQYGQVYKATLRKVEDSGIKRTVAVKTIKKYKTQRDKDDFLKEMNMMLGMVHPNIVQIFGLVQKDPPWMVMEYLQYGDLKNFLTVNKRPIEKLLQYMLDIAMGMHYIAEKGLVHRDLAARNIIVSDNEICKVSDFGLLREIPKDDITYESTTAGGMFPIRWMAPESLQRREFSPASDVWSFGVVLWEMYYPKVTPYSKLRKSEVGRGVVGGSLRLEPPEEYPTVVKKIMKACWHSDPVKRPSFLLISTLLTSTAFGH